jgi:hypothetical protein
MVRPERIWIGPRRGLGRFELFVGRSGSVLQIRPEQRAESCFQEPRPFVGSSGPIGGSRAVLCERLSVCGPRRRGTRPIRPRRDWDRAKGPSAGSGPRRGWRRGCWGEFPRDRRWLWLRPASAFPDRASDCRKGPHGAPKQPPSPHGRALVVERWLSGVFPFYSFSSCQRATSLCGTPRWSRTRATTVSTTCSTVVGRV